LRNDRDPVPRSGPTDQAAAAFCHPRHRWVYWAPFFLAGGALVLGIPVYLSQRSHMTEPEPVPAYR
jgi:hypothetical protein